MKTISVDEQIGNLQFVQEMQKEIICLLCRLDIPYDELEVLLPLILNKSDNSSIKSLFQLYAFEEKDCWKTCEAIKGKYKNLDICPGIHKHLESH